MLTASGPRRDPLPGADLLRVGVVAGGLSHEREISLRSGARLAHALRATDSLQVSSYDLDGSLLASIERGELDCVFPLVHGGLGEDGGLQGVLELAGVPFVGSGSQSARLSLDKPVAGAILSRAGLPVPRSLPVTAAAFHELGAGSLLRILRRGFELPLIVKPAVGGSALGISRVTSAAALAPALMTAFGYGPVAVVQEFVRGTEVAVGVVERDQGAVALPPVVVEGIEGKIYDFDAHYSRGDIGLAFPGTVGDTSREILQDIAVRAVQALGLRDWARVDLIVSTDGCYVLEVASCPGLTETSLFPAALEAAGETLGSWGQAAVLRAVRRAR